MKFYRINQQIRAPKLRVLDGGGKQIGILAREEALTKAQEEGIDLVEIAQAANPPVAKLIDFKKFRYLEEKRQREARKNTKHSGIKELRLGPFMSENDLQVRIERSKKFLKEGFKLRLAVKFAGRQITHPEFGWQLLNRFIKELEDVGKIERPPKFEGKILSLTFTPGKGKHGKTEDTKGSSETV